MRTIKAQYKHKLVEIYLKNNLLHEIDQFLNPSRHYFIITDANVAPLYLSEVISHLPKSESFIIPAGEASKTIETALSAIRDMLGKGIDRKTTLVALGGGVVGDISGFVAGIYKRGIPYIQIPTTLLAQIDSSIGGKTGIDFQGFKNQIGLINHPDKILVNPEVLKTLPQGEWQNGYAEAIKYAITLDKNLYFNLLNDMIPLEEMIFKDISIKVNITMKDELETKERMILNFGHTIGHALESSSGYRMSHGQAVALGMVYETTDPEIRKAIISLLSKYELPYELEDYDINRLTEYIKADKKSQDGKLTIPVVKEIGTTELISRTFDEWKEMWK
jgi:3-dehydroquinate synthase